MERLGIVPKRETANVTDFTEYIDTSCGTTH